MRSKSWVTPELGSHKREAGGCTRLFRYYAPQDNLLRYMLKNMETCWELPYLGKSFWWALYPTTRYTLKTLSSQKDSVQIPSLKDNVQIQGPPLWTLHKTSQAAIPLTALPNPSSPLSSWADVLTLLLPPFPVTLHFSVHLKWPLIHYPECILLL